MSACQVAAYSELFLRSDRRTVFRAAIDGSLRDCPVRGVAWRFFLVAPAGHGDARLRALIAHVDSARAAYHRLCTEFVVDPRECEASLPISLANPLSLDESSPWSSFFEHEELREQIKQDLRRLHPGHNFFARPECQEAMLRILFVWCRLHPALSYRQGMHELLAPLFHVIHLEAAEAGKAAAAQEAVASTGARATAMSATTETSESAVVGVSCNGDGDGGSVATMPSDRGVRSASQLRLLLSADEVEADAYALFDLLMHHVGPWFEPGSRPPRPSPRGGDDTLSSPLLRKCAHIQHELLRQADPPLHARLRALEVAPQLYLLRWLRLLFGHEFTLDEVKVVWDAIFAYGQGMKLVEYVALAMVISVRSELLVDDHSAVLRRLIKYPPVPHVHALVERALLLCRTLNAQSPSAYVPHISHPQLPPQPTPSPPAQAPPSATAVARQRLPRGTGGERPTSTEPGRQDAAAASILPPPPLLVPAPTPVAALPITPVPQTTPLQTPGSSFPLPPPPPQQHPHPHTPAGATAAVEQPPSLPFPAPPLQALPPRTPSHSLRPPHPPHPPHPLEKRPEERARPQLAASSPLPLAPAMAPPLWPADASGVASAPSACASAATSCCAAVSAQHVPQPPAQPHASFATGDTTTGTATRISGGNHSELDERCPDRANAAVKARLTVVEDNCDGSEGGVVQPLARTEAAFPAAYSVMCARLVEMMEAPLQELTLKLATRDESGEVPCEDPLGAAAKEQQVDARAITAIETLRKVQGTLRNMSSHGASSIPSTSSPHAA